VRFKERLDWADAAVPVVASIGFVIKERITAPDAIIGRGLGEALAVAVVFIGVRQALWALDRGPRRPLLAASVGILFWAFILFR
jgi:hypothetical protein